MLLQIFLPIVSCQCQIDLLISVGLSQIFSSKSFSTRIQLYFCKSFCFFRLCPPITKTLKISHENGKNEIEGCRNNSNIMYLARILAYLIDRPAYRMSSKFTWMILGLK